MARSVNRAGQTRTFLVFAILMIGWALQENNGHYARRGLLMVVAGTALALVALIMSRGGSSHRFCLSQEPQDRGGWRARLLDPLGGFAGVAATGLAINILMLVLAPAGIYLSDPYPHDRPWIVGAMGVASAAIALMIWNPERARTVWFPVVMLAALTTGVWMIGASPDPKIDVVTVHHYAFRAMEAGTSPYAMTFPNIYRNSHYYPEGMTADGQVLFGFPYPPLSLLMSLAGHIWFGDFRYAELCALLVGTGLMVAAPRTSGARANVAPLAASLILFTPRSLFVLEQGWTESFAICWLGASVYAACRAPRLLPWTLALLVNIKQYLLPALPLSLLLLPPPGDLRATYRLLWPSLLTAVVLAAPFLIWDAVPFVNSIVFLQFKEPFRGDSLSLLSAVTEAGWAIGANKPVLVLVPALALTGSLAVASRWADRSIAGFSVSLAFSLLLLFLLSKQAFCNYYYFVIALLCAAVAASSHEGPAPAGDVDRASLDGTGPAILEGN